MREWSHERGQEFFLSIPRARDAHVVQEHSGEYLLLLAGKDSIPASPEASLRTAALCFRAELCECLKLAGQRPCLLELSDVIHSVVQCVAKGYHEQRHDRRLTESTSLVTDIRKLRSSAFSPPSHHLIAITAAHAQFVAIPEP